jgi:hypothetical protein
VQLKERKSWSYFVFLHSAVQLSWPIVYLFALSPLSCSFGFWSRAAPVYIETEPWRERRSMVRFHHCRYRTEQSDYWKRLILSVRTKPIKNWVSGVTAVLFAVGVDRKQHGCCILYSFLFRCGPHQHCNARIMRNIWISESISAHKSNRTLEVDRRPHRQSYSLAAS